MVFYFQVLINKFQFWPDPVLIIVPAAERKNASSLSSA